MGWAPAVWLQANRLQSLGLSTPARSRELRERAVTCKHKAPPKLLSKEEAQPVKPSPAAEDLWEVAGHQDHRKSGFPDCQRDGKERRPTVGASGKPLWTE